MKISYSQKHTFGYVALSLNAFTYKGAPAHDLPDQPGQLGGVGVSFLRTHSTSMNLFFLLDE